jgi:DNA-binding GntR family transcriptional regulator
VTKARPYQQIAQVIREQIIADELSAGELIPSVRDLVRTHEVAMATAQRAVRTLQAEGYVRPERGVGNVVTPKAERGWSASAWVEQARRSGRVYTTSQHARVLHAELVDAPDQVAGALGLDEGAPVIRRDRVTIEDERAVSASTSWFPGDLAASAPRLLDLGRIQEGTFVYVAAQTGRRFAGWQDQYEPVVATAEEAGLLGLDAGVALHRGRNWVYDADGDVLEYGESLSTGRITYSGRIDT